MPDYARSSQFYVQVDWSDTDDSDIPPYGDRAVVSQLYAQVDWSDDTGDLPPPPPRVPFFLWRNLREKPLFPSLYEGGRHLRRDGFDENKSIPRVHFFLSRTRPETPPYPTQLNGRVVRREGYSENFQPLVPKQFFTRFVPSKPPHPTGMTARFIRREGIEENETVPRVVFFLRRDLREKPAHPSDLNGSVIRREGYPEDIPQPEIDRVHFFLRRNLREKPPHPSQLNPGRIRREGWVEDDAQPIIPRRKVTNAPLPHPSFMEAKYLRRGAFFAPPFVEFSQTYEQVYRVADSQFDRYELFVGEDSSPNLKAPPTATSATLPFSFTPTYPGPGLTKTLHIVVRRRNKYNLQSFNIYETLKVIDETGAEVLGSVSVPIEVAVYDRDSGEIRVVAKYLNTEDANPADTWEIFTKVGADPVPGVDPAAFTGAMVFSGVQSGLAQTLTGYTPGDVVHVLVVAKRASDSKRGLADVVQHTIASLLDLSDGQSFGAGGEVF